MMIQLQDKKYMDAVGSVQLNEMDWAMLHIYYSTALCYSKGSKIK